MHRRVTVVGLSVSVKSHLTSGVSATEGKKFVGFSLKLLHCTDRALLPLKAIRTLAIFLWTAHEHGTEVSAL